VDDEEFIAWDSSDKPTVNQYLLAIKTMGSTEEPLVFTVYTWDDDCVFRYGEILSAIYL
jgi:hypothetical protein